MSSIRKSVSKLFLATIGMFLFGFALVPLYDVFCEITGLNGKVTGPTYGEYENVGNREIKITFTTTNNNDMPWFFDSSKSQMKVKTGEQNLLDYVFTNTTQTQRKISSHYFVYLGLQLYYNENHKKKM